jgi:hypothetical protein
MQGSTVNRRLFILFMIYLYIRTDLTMSDRRYVEYRLDGIDNTREFIIVHTLGCFVEYR